MSDSPYPSQNQDKFVLRLPDGMRDRIKAAAEASNRSMNAEIIATLEEKYPAPKEGQMREFILALLSALGKDPNNAESKRLLEEAQVKMRGMTDKYTLRVTVDETGRTQIAVVPAEE